MDSIVNEAIEKRDDSIGYNSDSRSNGREDMAFEEGGEAAWDTEVWTSRGKRPKVSIDSVSVKKHNLANDLRDLNPEIKIIPKKDEFEKHALVRNAIIKDIQDRSCAESIYDSCFNQGLSAGFSFMKVDTEWVNPTTHDQQIVIKNLRNNMAVHTDFNYTNPCFIDMKWGQVEYKISDKEYKDKYGSMALSSWESDAFHQDQYNASQTLCEYYRLVDKPVKLLMLSNEAGDIVEGYKDDRKIIDLLENEVDGYKVWTVSRDRESYRRQLERYILNGEDILEEKKDVLGSFIPIVPYEARSLMIEGKRQLVSFIRNLKEPARLKNYAKSLEVELVAMQPLNTWVAPMDAVKEHMNFWSTANTKKWSVLPYNHKDAEGNPLPPPIKQPYSGPTNALSGLFQTYDKDLADISGMYNDNIGGPSQLRAGVAIDLKQSQGNHNNFDYMDNFTSRTLKYMGIVLNDLITLVHDGEQEVSMVGKGSKRETVQINQGGDSVDLSQGDFEVTTVIGSATESKQKESNDMMMELLRSVPAMQNAAHIIAGNLTNMEDKDELVSILKASLPPGVLDLSKADPQSVAIENKQLKGQLEQITQQFEQAEELIKSMKIDSDTKLQVQDMKSDTDLQRELIKADAKVREQEKENQGEIIQALIKNVEFLLNERTNAQANKAIGETLSTNQE